MGHPRTKNEHRFLAKRRLGMTGAELYVLADSHCAELRSLCGWYPYARFQNWHNFR